MSQKIETFAIYFPSWHPDAHYEKWYGKGFSEWELVKTTKEEITKLINISATKVPHDSPANELAMMVLNISSNLGKKLPNDVALEYIKKEVSHHF